jgi:hypothetical protein
MYRSTQHPTTHERPSRPSSPTAEAATDIVKTTIAERAKVYGDATLSHENIGLAWTALIQQHYQIKLDHPLPSWIVELMMVNFKVQRSSLVYHADNFVDIKAYLQFAEKDQQQQTTKHNAQTI